MEFSFTLLVLAALAGMIAKLVFGWDPWKLLGSLAFILLLLPLIGLAFEDDPQIVQKMTNNAIDKIIAAMPSIFIGEAAGVVAGTILSSVRSLFKN